ncbi:MAG: hypothetical protein U0O22_07995 [Acutalibacteraceae bacterium]
MIKFKKSIAVALGAVMISSTMGGCVQATVFGSYPQDLSWSYKDDTSTMSIGEYIYYNYNAFYSASEKVENGKGDFLDQKLKTDDGEEMTARAYIEKTVDDACKNYLYINKTFEDMGLSLTADEISSYKSNADMYWSYMRAGMNSYGVSEESFVSAGYENAAKMEVIFKNLYQKGGEKEVPFEDLKKYYEENYVNYSYFSVPLYTSDTDENQKTTNTKMSADKIAKYKTDFDKYAKAINKGTSYKDEVAVYMKDYKVETDPTISATNILENAGLGEDIQKTLENLKDGQSKYIVVGEDGDTPTIYLIYRGNITEESKKLSDDATTQYSVLVNMKSEEFQDDVAAAAEKYQCEKNTAAIEKYPCDMFITEPASEVATQAE